MVDLTRRNALLAAGASVAAGTVMPAGESAAASKVSYKPRPLPFDPAAVEGLSERLMRSHHERNYTGAVRRLGAIQSELATLDPSTAAGYSLNGLKREELMALNSMILHEIYFAGFNDRRTPGKALGARIETDFGSFDRWAAEFSAMGKALGGGSGWVLLTWSPRAGRLMNLWAADHTHTGADGRILLALDMYEHAYAMDYGANAGAYVTAYMKAAGWAHADRAFAEK